MDETPGAHRHAGDIAVELTDDNNLRAHLEFEQMLTAASRRRLTGGPWLDKPVR